MKPTNLILPGTEAPPEESWLICGSCGHVDHAHEDEKEYGDEGEYLQGAGCSHYDCICKLTEKEVRALAGKC